MTNRETPEPLAAVIAVVTEMATTIGAIQETLVQQNKTLAAAPTKRFLVNTNTIVTVLLLIALYAGLVSLNQQTKADEERRQQTRDLITRINSCVDPAGDCAKRGADGTAAVIQQLVCLNESDLRKVVPERASNLPPTEACVALGIV